MPESRGHTCWLERDRNHACLATSCLANSVFCLSFHPSFDISPFSGSSRAPSPCTLAENMDRPWQYCRWNHPVSSDMIYAAAFHIFHCFQVFGSICKIKFVMRPTTPDPAASPPPRRPAFLRAQLENRRIWPTGQFPSGASIEIWMLKFCRFCHTFDDRQRKKKRKRERELCLN